MQDQQQLTKFEALIYKASQVIPAVFDLIIALIAPAFGPKYLPFWLSVSAAILDTLAMRSVYNLFADSIGVDPVAAALCAFASVGILSVTLLIVVMSKNNALRGMGYLIIAAWMLITFALVALGSVLSNNRNIEVPDALIGLGKTVAGLLPALAIVPVVTMTIALFNTTPFPNASAAAGHYFGFVLKLVMIGASSFANIYFGLARNIQPVVAILCGVLLESLFMWALFKLLAATATKDRFDIGVWSVMLILTGAFLAFVGIETIATLSGLQIAAINDLQETGALIYVSAIGLSFALTIIAQLTTSWIDWIPSAADVRGAAYSIAKRIPTRTPTREIAPQIQVNQPVAALHSAHVVADDEVSVPK